LRRRLLAVVPELASPAIAWFDPKDQARSRVAPRVIPMPICEREGVVLPSSQLERLVQEVVLAGLGHKSCGRSHLQCKHVAVFVIAELSFGTMQGLVLVQADMEVAVKLANDSKEPIE